MRTPQTLMVAFAAFASLVPSPEAQALPKIVSGSAVRTAGVAVGERGAEWRLPGGPVIRAQPGAELRVIGEPRDVQIHPRKSRPVYTVLLRKGRIDVEVPGSAESAVAVAGPRKVTVLVRSGSLGMKASPAQVVLANFDAEALVAVGNFEFHELGRGTIRVVERTGVKDTQMIQPPSELSGQRVFMSSGRPVLLDKLSWTSREGASGYRVELVRDSERRPLFSIETREPQLPRAQLALEPGKYRVLIKALDGWGFESVRALESSLHVVAATLPLGAYFDTAGRIRLVPGSRVQLAHVEGLEMTYSKTWYRAAESTVGIDGDEPITMFLRYRGSDEHVPLRFAPRTVRARVALKPPRATWPRDPISLNVALEDPSGQPVPEWLQMHVKIQVGIEEIEVPLEAYGRTLRGTLMPQGGTGPWVVRVDVKDQFGFPLGRNLLEISRTATKDVLARADSHAHGGPSLRR